MITVKALKHLMLCLFNLVFFFQFHLTDSLAIKYQRIVDVQKEVIQGLDEYNTFLSHVNLLLMAMNAICVLVSAAFFLAEVGAFYRLKMRLKSVWEWLFNTTKKKTNGY